VEARLDLQAFSAGRDFVGGHHPRPEAAGLVEILAHVPLRGLALEFAHRTLVEARETGDAGIGVLHGEMTGALANDYDHFGLVVERVGDLRPHDRLAVRDERGLAAHEDGRKLRHVVALKTFLHVLHVVETEADVLGRPRNREAVLETLERVAGAGGRLLGEIGERLEGAPGLREHVGEGRRAPRVDRPPNRHHFAPDPPRAQSLIGFKTYDFHGVNSPARQRASKRSRPPGEVHIGCDRARLHAVAPPTKVRASLRRTASSWLRVIRCTRRCEGLQHCTADQLAQRSFPRRKGNQPRFQALCLYQATEPIMITIPGEIRAPAVLMAALFVGTALIGGSVLAEGSGRWSQGAAMPTERTEVAVAEMGGKIYVVGG